MRKLNKRNPTKWNPTRLKLNNANGKATGYDMMAEIKSLLEYMPWYMRDEVVPMIRHYMRACDIEPPARHPLRLALPKGRCRVELSPC